PIPEAAIGDWADMHAVDNADVNAWRTRRPAKQVQRARAGYYGNITFIDHQIGRLIYELKKYHLAAWQTTMVIFLSDHGDMMGDHHPWRTTDAYEGSARIPMIVRTPATWEGPRGQVRDEVVERRDVMPTFLEAAGLAPPQTVTGRSMMPLVRGETAPW